MSVRIAQQTFSVPAGKTKIHTDFYKNGPFKVGVYVPPGATATVKFSISNPDEIRRGGGRFHAAENLGPGGIVSAAESAEPVTATDGDESGITALQVAAEGGTVVVEVLE